MPTRLHFKGQPFYVLLAELVGPTSLTTDGDKDLQREVLQFQFTPQHVEDIRSSLTHNAGAIPQFQLQVHLRFRSLHASGNQEDSYPFRLTVKVNGRNIALPAPIPSKTPNGSTELICLPINIVSSCYLSSFVGNSVSLTWNAVPGQEFAAVVFLVRKLSPEMLLSDLRLRRWAMTETIIRKARRSASGEDISVTRLRISLICPLSKARISVPCRARSCKHLECFDAARYLQVNEQRPRWVCPVCGQRATYASLIIDQLFANILEKSTGDFVVFNEDGSWTTSAEQQGCEIGCSGLSSASPPSLSSSVEQVRRPIKIEDVAVIE